MIEDSGWQAKQAVADRPNCPRCGTAGPYEIGFGLLPALSDDDLAACERLRLTFAGCVVEDVEWECGTCAFTWGDESL